MFNWFRKNNDKTPRSVLENALSDFGAASLIPQALAFYDDYTTFSEYADEHGFETPWDADDYVPTPPEIAYEIFFNVLSSTGRIGFIDWADGSGTVLDVFTELLRHAGAAPLSAEEIKTFSEKAATAQRGEAFMKLYDDLDSAMQARGLVLTCFGTGGDAHHPVLLSPEAYKHWMSAKFGKGFPVIP